MHQTKYKRRQKRRIAAFLLALIFFFAVSPVHVQAAPDFTGSFLRLQLVCTDGNSNLAIITFDCESMFFATSINMTDWALQSPATGWYIKYDGVYYWYVDGLHSTTDWRANWQYHPAPDYDCYEWDYALSLICETNENIQQIPSLDLRTYGITLIERLPYDIAGEIVWVGFATRGGNRRQINIFANNQHLNHLWEGAMPAISGIDGVRWAREAIEFIVARDLMDLRLCDETGHHIAFDPQTRATRGEVLAAAVRALGLVAPELPYDEVHIPFYDVDLWGRGEYIDIAKRLGLVSGIGNNLFAPDRAITRQDMMTMLYNILLAMGRIQPDYMLRSLARFNDATEIADYARLPIASLARAGIIAGDGVRINPRGYLTRVEAAMFVWNLYRIGS